MSCFWGSLKDGLSVPKLKEMLLFLTVETVWKTADRPGQFENNNNSSKYLLSAYI